MDREAFRLHLEENGNQVDRVFQAMRHGGWWTKPALAKTVRGSAHAMSARMSELAAAGATIHKKYGGRGRWLYRMVRHP